MTTNTALFEKVYNFLRDSPLEHITAVSIVNQVIEEEPWFPKEDSRQLIYNAIASIKILFKVGYFTLGSYFYRHMMNSAESR